MDVRAGRDAVDAALTLLAEQGFDATSTAQIAEVTGIPADDVVPTLGTKEAIILTIAEEMLGAVVKALADIDPQTPLIEALMSAHSAVLGEIIADTGPVSLDRMRRMGKAITSSPDLQKKVAAQRVEMLTGVLADRFGAPATDRRVQSGLKLWSAVLAATYLDVLDRHGRFDPLVDEESPEYMRNRLNRAFRIVTGRGTRACKKPTNGYTQRMSALLIPGQTCWRIARADRFACIVDAADYFKHVKTAMLRAQHRITLIGWDLDARMTFERGEKTLPGPNQLGAFLYWMLWKRPNLEVYLLKSNLRLLPAFDGIWFGLTPVSFVNQFSSKRMHFAIDGARPMGAVHHQKIAVIDDSVAFCGGLDLTVDRWDTSAHEHDNRGRRTVGRSYGPRHEVAAAVDGEAACALSEQARERWETATGLPLPPVDAKHEAWPSKLEPTMRDVDVGIARTLPELEGRDEVREVEALNLAAIAAARHTIYLENQYLAASRVADALASRLAESDGPEVVIVLPRRGSNRLERETMDGARHRLIHVLWEADEHGRLGIYYPVTDGGTPIYVHSKVMVIDDHLLRIGSSNLNNRSMGFDSECDIAIEAHSHNNGLRRQITAVRDQLVAEHLGVPADELEKAVAQSHSLREAVEKLHGDGKTLRPFTEQTVSGEASPLAENDLMDPDHVPRSLTRSVQRFIAGLRPDR